MPDSIEITILDYSNEREAITVDDLGMTAQDIQDWTDAIDALTTGTIVRADRIVVTRIITGSAIPPSDPFSQIETQWKLSYTDNVTGQNFALYIPTADLALLNQPSSDVLDLTLAPIAGIVADIETVLLSPVGNAITVNKIEAIAAI